MHYAYFLTSGMVCMLAITEGGQTIDVAVQTASWEQLGFTPMLGAM